MTTTYLVYDIVTGQKRAEIPLSGVTYGELLNDSGGLLGSISARHPKATQEILDPGTTAIFVDRNGTIVWGGVLWRINATSGTEKATLALSANTFWSMFQELSSRGRYIETTQHFTDVDQLQIARTLIDYVQDEGIHGAEANYGISTGSELTTDNGGAQQLRTVHYHSWEKANVGKIVEQLAALQNGFEFDIVCRYNGNDIEKVFRLFYPVIQDTPGILFEYPTNILNYSLHVNAQRQAKKVYAIGAGEGIATLAATAEDPELSNYPMREATFPYKDVTEQATIDGHADADLLKVRYPSMLPTLTMRTNVAEIYPGAFRCGANINVRINDGWVQLDALYRVVQWDCHIDDDGAEHMVIRVNDAEVLV